MKLAIYTQHLENYGAHDWSGEGECPQYWKAKGGEVYVVENLTGRQVAKIEDEGIPTLSKLLSRDDNYYRDYVANYRIVDDAATICDEWETPTVLSYENGKWIARQNSKNNGFWHRLVESRKVEYVLDDYENSLKTEWILTDGRRGTYEEVAAFLQNSAS